MPAAVCVPAVMRLSSRRLQCSWVTSSSQLPKLDTRMQSSYRLLQILRVPLIRGGFGGFHETFHPSASSPTSNGKSSEQVGFEPTFPACEGQRPIHWTTAPTSQTYQGTFALHSLQCLLNPFRCARSGLNRSVLRYFLWPAHQDVPSGACLSRLVAGAEGLGHPRASRLRLLRCTQLGWHAWI